MVKQNDGEKNSEENKTEKPKIAIPEPRLKRESPPELEKVSPGALLRKARQKQRLELKDVAKLLRLSPTVLQHLESDAFDKLPAVIFVRGYLRSYANLMNIPEVEVLQAFDSFGVSDKPVKVKTHLIESEGGHRSHGKIRWLSYMVAVLLIVLTLVWWSIHSNTNVTTRAGSKSSLKSDASAIVPISSS